ncbi:MAG: hypothetical protein MUE49_12525 [Rhodospirillales bacterium]|nr:hypothetical protein [Rhodospirillales bacterium]
MTETFEIEAAWERLTEGPPEERACFGTVTLRSGQILLSEGVDGYVNSRRDGPLVSNYHLAEWLAWNWWRLTAEPKGSRETPEWAFAHSLATIGEGYVWPNITIWSDLERTCLVARPSRKRGFASFRTTADWVVVLPTAAFEHAIERYVGQVQGRLRSDRVAGTNLDRIWEELTAERYQTGIATRRRLEALLGRDPDEADPAVIEQLVDDAAKLGRRAIDEIAAGHAPSESPLNAEAINEVALRLGADANPADAVHLQSLAALSPSGTVPAWQRGYEAAQALRKQEDLGDEPLSDDHLAEIAGVAPAILQRSDVGADFSFALDRTLNSGRVVLRPKWRTSRRFELARLVGDRVARGNDEPLLPATRAYTYRQKLQRAFAAELLCPLDALKTQLDGDYSQDAIESAAQYFEVSPLTVRTHLVNNRLLPREDIDDEVESSAAA